jgi:hypothetical protein
MSSNSEVLDASLSSSSSPPQEQSEQRRDLAGFVMTYVLDAYVKKAAVASAGLVASASRGREHTQYDRLPVHVKFQDRAVFYAFVGDDYALLRPQLARVASILYPDFEVDMRLPLRQPVARPMDRPIHWIAGGSDLQCAIPGWCFNQVQDDAGADGTDGTDGGDDEACCRIDVREDAECDATWLRIKSVGSRGLLRDTLRVPCISDSNDRREMLINVAYENEAVQQCVVDEQLVPAMGALTQVIKELLGAAWRMDDEAATMLGVEFIVQAGVNPYPSDIDFIIYE